MSYAKLVKWIYRKHAGDFLEKKPRGFLIKPAPEKEPYELSKKVDTLPDPPQADSLQLGSPKFLEGQGAP